MRFADEVIGNSLTLIYDQCLAKNYFPSALKLLKCLLCLNLAQQTIVNCRSVSLLSSVLKQLEKHLHKIVLHHLVHSDLIIDSQSGFRSKHSCHNALIVVIDNWHLSINNYSCGTVFVDIKKAIDMVDLDILISK